jgi:hypothetical protein
MPDLSLQIKASADSAIKSLDKLETKLTQLNGALDSISNVGQFQTLADGITNLSRAMSSLKANQTAKDFSTLANNLNKISNVNYAGIGALADGLTRLTPVLQDISGSNISGSVTRLVNALTKLSSANLSGLTNANFGRVGTELAQLTNTLANTEEVSIRTTKLVEALAKLSGAGSGMVAVTNAMPGLTTQLVRFFNAMASVSTVSEGTIQLTTALAQLANAGKRASATAGSLRTLGTELNNLIGILAKSPQVAGSTVELVKALSQISNQGVKINASTSGLRTNLNSLIPSLNKVNKHTKSLASTFGMFYAKFFLLLRAVKGVWSAVKSAMDFVEVYNYFDASIDQITQKATGDWQEAGYDSAEAYYDALYEGFSTQAKELTRKMSGYSLDEKGQLTREGTKNLGLDPKTMLNYQAQFAQLSSSMGIASDYAMKMSQALTEIGADLASVKNMEFQEVWDNMSSGIVGMSRAVDKYGVNIRNTALQQKLYDLGIDASITKLGQQDKALLRAITILDSTRYAWADLSDTLEQPANQLRMLKANLDSLGRTLGGALLGGIAALLPYINALTIALQRLIQYIIDFFGIQLVSISSQASNNIGDLIGSIDDTEDALGSASGAAKKLKQNLLGIDELNIINTDTSGGGAGGGVADYSDELKNAFDAIYDEYQKVWDKAYENVENRAKELSDKIVDAFKKGDYYAIGNTISTSIGDALKSIPWDKIYQFAKNWGSNLANFVNGLFNPETFAELGKTIASAINTALYFQGNFLDDLDPERIGLSLANFVNSLVETFDEKQLAHNISEGIKKALKIVSTFLQKTDFQAIGEAFGTFLKELDWKGILKGIWEVVLSAMSALLETFEGIFNADPLSAIIITGIATAFTVGNITKIFTSVGAISGIQAFGTSLAGTFATAFMGGIVGYGLGDWLGKQIYGDEEYEKWSIKNNIGTLTDWLADQFDLSKAFERTDWGDTLYSESKTYNMLSNLFSGKGFVAGGGGGSQKRHGGDVTDIDTSNIENASVKFELFQRILTSVEDTIANTQFFKLADDTEKSSDAINDFSNTLSSINFSDVNKSANDYSAITDTVSKNTNSMSGAMSGAFNQIKTFGIEQGRMLDVFRKYDDTLKTSADNQNKYRENLKKSSEAYNNLDVATKVTKGNIDLLGQSTILSSQSMIQSLTSVSTFFTDTFSQVFGMDNITSMLSTLPKAFSVVFKNTANVVIGIFNQMIKSINQAMQVSWDDIDFGGEKVVQKGKAQLLKISPIQSFSLGGFPSGENGLFYANSSEMVGRFTNGKTAVANNDQIVAGIEQGVYNAVMSAMSQGTQNVNVVLEGDAEGIFRVVRQQNRIYKNSTGASAFA